MEHSGWISAGDDEQAEYAQALLSGQKVPVLGGFVRLVDRMGDDGAVLAAAVCASSKITPSNSGHAQAIASYFEQGRKDLLEMCVIKLHICMPIMVELAFYEHWRCHLMPIDPALGAYTAEDRIEALPQGRARDGFANLVSNVHSMSAQAMQFCEKMQVPADMAQVNLTLAHFRQGYWKTNVFCLMRFLEKALKPAANYALQQYAEVIATILGEWMPLTWGAFASSKLTHLLEEDDHVSEESNKGSHI